VNPPKCALYPARNSFQGLQKPGNEAGSNLLAVRNSVGGVEDFIDEYSPRRILHIYLTASIYREMRGLAPPDSARSSLISGTD